MRRPLKPFVTEYKSPTRRSKDAQDMSGLGASDVQPDAGSDAPRPFMPADDSSYEAAMRAADALFSGGPAAPQPSPKPSAAVADVFQPAPKAASAAPERPSGRILQAIDETAADPFAELEAEHAPKRRGRKPGSKNKPKIATAMAATLDVEPFAPAPPARATPRPAAAARPKPQPRAEHTQPVAMTTSPAKPAKEPFSWVRTQLRPGEKWKRRIPKVAW